MDGRGRGVGVGGRGVEWVRGGGGEWMGGGGVEGSGSCIAATQHKTRDVQIRRVGQ